MRLCPTSFVRFSARSQAARRKAPVIRTTTQDDLEHRDDTPPATDAAPPHDPLLPVNPFMLVDRHADPQDLLRLVFAGRQVDGTEPHVCSLVVPARVPASELLLDGAVVNRSSTTGVGCSLLARYGNCTVLIEEGISTAISVSGHDVEHTQTVAGLIEAKLPQPRPDDTVPIATWYMVGPDQVVRRDRGIKAPRWEEIQRNYPSPTRARLEAL